MSNGLLSMTIGSNGLLNALVKNGTPLMTSTQTMFVSSADSSGGRMISATTQTVVSQTSQRVELSFVDTGGAMNWDLHYVMQSGLSGFYYFLVADTNGKPPLTIGELRTVERFDPAIFSQGFNAERQGALPSAAVASTFMTGNDIQDVTWELPDAGVLPGIPGPEGPVYTVYDWATYVSRDWEVGHGIYGNGFGAWLLTGSPEYVSGGPMKQELMVDVSNTILNMYAGGHFGSNLSTPTPPNWQKLYGPSLLFVDTGSDAQVLAGAAAQAAIERAAWPYCWLKNAANQADRSTVDGTLAVTANRSAAGAMVTLADPTELYTQGNGYIYWSQADARGHFVIKNVRPGTYAVHAYATQGDITSSVAAAASTSGSPADAGTGQADASATVAVAQDNTEIVDSGVAIAAGATHLGTLVWSPVVHPNELWVIGTSDRTSGEFLVSGTTVAGAALREYGPSATQGLWDIPPANLTYTIGSSTPAEDWYFAQSKVGVWNVDFALASAVTGNAYLTIAIAGVSQNPQLSVSINGHAIFTQTFGNDGTLYRSALTSGRYQLVTVTFPGSYLVVGAASTTNVLAFDMTSAGSGSGIMYDLIKLETD